MEKILFPRIASYTTSNEAWKALKDGYQGSAKVKKVKLQTLKMEFENLKINQYEKVDDYCMREKSCVNKMETLGEEVKNEVIMKKVLRTLLPKWNHVAIIIKERKNIYTLNYD